MKKVLLSFALIIALTGQVFAAAQPLLPANFVEVENGSIIENTLLASDDGEVFIEFSKDTKFVNAEEKLNFSGEILPPQVIELDISRPRGLMEELSTFEMVSNSGADVIFMDRYDRLSRKNLFRESLLNPDGLSRSSWVKLVYPVSDPLVSLPKLWEWQGEEDGWFRIGGNLTETEGSDVRILSAVLRRTGIYSVFDENPPPRHFADEYEIYPKNYAESELIEDDYYGNNLGFAEDFSEEENFAGFHPAGPPPTTSYDIPSMNSSENTQFIEDLQQNMVENSAKITPETQQKIDRLVFLVGEKIKNEQAVEMITGELNQISSTLADAQSTEERENLEKSFLELQTELYELNQESTDEDELNNLKREVNNFFAGIPAESLSTNTFGDTEEEFIDRSPPGEEFYIPENAQLTQSGGEDQQGISWAFPLFLLICFGLLGWGIISSRKKLQP